MLAFGPNGHENNADVNDEPQEVVRKAGRDHPGICRLRFDMRCSNRSLVTILFSNLLFPRTEAL